MHGDPSVLDRAEPGPAVVRPKPGPLHAGRRGAQAGSYSTDFSRVAISAGFLVTLMPHSSITASFSVAVPLPPEMMAPAWPMRFPAGAVTPAMNPTTGFFM